MSNKEHRRIAFAAAAITTPDLDWAGLHTLWSTQWAVGSGLASGEILELSPRHGALSIYYEVYDGVGDNAALVVPGSVTISAQIVTRHVNRTLDVFELGSLVTNHAPQRRHIELEVPTQGRSALRVISAAGLPTAGGLWFYASEDMRT